MKHTPGLRRALCVSHRPTLAEVLDPGDIFVDIGVGVDLGYNDVMTVASHDDLHEELSRSCAAFEQRILAFEELDPVDVPAYWLHSRRSPAEDPPVGGTGRKYGPPCVARRVVACPGGAGRAQARTGATTTKATSLASGSST